MTASQENRARSQSDATLHERRATDNSAPRLAQDLPNTLFEHIIFSGPEHPAVAAEAAYIWDVVSDTLTWEDKASSVLGVLQPERIATATSFNFMIAPEHLERRRAVFTTAAGEDLGKGVPYHVQFRFMPRGARSQTSIWLEEQGRWWAGANGRPVRARGVVRVVNENFREKQQQLYSSDHDELTGRLTRIRLTEAVSAVIERSLQSGQTCGLLIAGINNLAIVNEAFGFDVGDDVIASVGRILGDEMRAGDTIGRYSANKFGIVLNDCGPEAMRIAAERLIRSVREATIRSIACPLTAMLSVGGVLIPTHARTVDGAISSALQALDEAKTRRYDCFVAFEADPGRESTRRRNIAIADEVISALDDNRMRLVLQPIVDSKTGEPKFYEALMRMAQPDGSVISAGEFVHVAEQLGLSRLIDRRTLELAVALLKQDTGLKLSLNVSGLTCGDQAWLAALQHLTGRDRQITSRLIVEITETAAIHDLNQSIAFVDTLKEIGCQVAIDDFGAGYTSFKNLKHLAVDMVKIDGGFVRNLPTDPSDRVFLETMVTLANSFGMETVAEWVGCEETAKIASDVGVTYLQGFHYGRPLAVEAVVNGGRDPVEPTDRAVEVAR
ncbi:MAG: GGDEF and EAL domain-containing protein [Hyphomicrobiaceae bacterium]|nr:GGDEF and EAL domain-containing protein [Hyphomicrobiaceae bacterium]